MNTRFRVTLAMAAAIWAAGIRANADVPIETFEVGSLHVERYGAQGSPIVLIPGLACGSWVWRDTIAHFKSHHQIYAITLAGFDGRPARGDANFEQIVTSLHELIVSRHLIQPTLIGHSMGGTLGLLYAERHPNALRGVVSVDGLPVFPGTENVSAGERASMADRVRLQLDAGTPEQFAAQQLAYMRTIGVMSEERAQALAKLSSRSDPHATANYATADMQLDLRSALQDIKVPVLEIVPYQAAEQAALGLDETGKLAYYRSLLSGVARLTIVPISPSRHFVMVDQFQALMKTLDGFLDKSGT